MNKISLSILTFLFVCIAFAFLHNRAYAQFSPPRLFPNAQEPETNEGGEENEEEQPSISPTPTQALTPSPPVQPTSAPTPTPTSPPSQPSNPQMGSGPSTPPQQVEPVVITFPQNEPTSKITPTPTPELVPLHIITEPVIPSPRPTEEVKKESTTSAVAKPPLFGLWSGPSQDFYKSSRLDRPSSILLSISSLTLLLLGLYLVKGDALRRLFKKEPQPIDRRRYIYYFTRPTA